jgi:TonB family protein
MPLAITDLHPKLQVSPTLLDVPPPPKIEEKLTYGDPQAQFLKLSAGPGIEGIATGTGFGDGAGSGAGSGYGSRGYGGGAFGMGDVSQRPVLIYKVEPDYTDQARKARYQGTVLLRLVIDERGEPKEIRVIRTLGLGLDEKAVEAVYHWRFRPGLKDGRAVAVDANVEVSFHFL